MSQRNEEKSISNIEDEELRLSWKAGSFCLIYSRSNKKWYNGKIEKISVDSQNEDEHNDWLVVKYDKKKTKHIQRFSAAIKPLPNNHVLSLIIGSYCLIYSNVIEKWCKGEVIDIVHDIEGEWLKVKYIENNEFTHCDIQRFSNELKALASNTEQFIYPEIGCTVQIKSTNIVKKSFEVIGRICKSAIYHKYGDKYGTVIAHHPTNGIKIQFDDNISLWYEPDSIIILSNDNDNIINIDRLLIGDKVLYQNKEAIVEFNENKSFLKNEIQIKFVHRINQNDLKRVKQKRTKPTTFEHNDDDIKESMFHGCRTIEKRPITAVKEANRGKRLIVQPDELWGNGKTLRVYFMEGKNSQHIAIMNKIKDWSKCCNIKFKQTADLENSSIRIKFNQSDGSWSVVGRAANIYKEKCTMNFGWPNVSTDGTVLHEFGHALGFDHEHSHPIDQIPYDKEKVYESYRNSQGWSKSDVDDQVFSRPYPTTVDGFDNKIDKDSIMRYSIDPELLLESRKKDWAEFNFQATEFSDIDKQKAYRFYPFFYPKKRLKVQILLQKDVEESFKIAKRGEDDIKESLQFCGKRGRVIQHHPTNGVKVEFNKENGKKMSCWYEPIALRILKEIKIGFKVQIDEDIDNIDYAFQIMKRDTNINLTDYGEYCGQEGIVGGINLENKDKGIEIQFKDNTKLWYEPISMEILDYFHINAEVKILSKKTVEKSFEIRCKEYDKKYTENVDTFGIIQERDHMKGIKVKFGHQSLWYPALSMKLLDKEHYNYYNTRQERYFVQNWVEIEKLKSGKSQYDSDYDSDSDSDSSDDGNDDKSNDDNPQREIGKIQFTNIEDMNINHIITINIKRNKEFQLENFDTRKTAIRKLKSHEIPKIAKNIEKFVWKWIHIGKVHNSPFMMVPGGYSSTTNARLYIGRTNIIDDKDIKSEYVIGTVTGADIMWYANSLKHSEYSTIDFQVLVSNYPSMFEWVQCTNLQIDENIAFIAYGHGNERGYIGRCIVEYILEGEKCGSSVLGVAIQGKPLLISWYRKTITTFDYQYLAQKKID